MRLGSLVLVGVLLPFFLYPEMSYAQAPQQPMEQERSPYKVTIFHIKHRDPTILAQALDGLRSGAPNTAMVPNKQLKTITVRDFPENIASIGEALKRLDVPEPKAPAAVPVNIEMQLHLIAASQQTGERSEPPASLAPVINQLRSTLKFSNYRYLTTFTSRLLSGGKVFNNGVIEEPFPQTQPARKSNYQYQVASVQNLEDSAGKSFFYVRSFSFNLTLRLPNGDARDIGFNTDLTLREGETAVVGTANVGSSDEAIILIVTARAVK